MRLFRILNKAFVIIASTIVNRIKFAYYGVSVGKPVKTRGVLHISCPRGTIAIGDGFTVNSGKHRNAVGMGFQTSLMVIGGGRIEIGNHVGMANVSIVSRKEVVIEDNVLIGNGACLWDTDFHSLSYQNRVVLHDRVIVDRPVHIREGAFIGAGTIVLKGVTVGEHSIVGAGSVVTKSIPPRQIWAGNPAVYIRDAVD